MHRTARITARRELAAAHVHADGYLASCVSQDFPKINYLTQLRQHFAHWLVIKVEIVAHEFCFLALNRVRRIIRRFGDALSRLVHRLHLAVCVNVRRWGRP